LVNKTGELPTLMLLLWSFSSSEYREKYMLSGCELIDTENISQSSQNMKFGGE
jgi:hypothetical protein